MSNFHYFNDAEIAKWQLEPELWARLDQARDKAGVPFVITSGRRTQDQNSSLRGAVSNSAHLSGLAVDMSTNGDDHFLNRILYGLGCAGFDRIGLYFSPDPNNPSRLIPHHVHCDISKVLPPMVTWALLEQNA